VNILRETLARLLGSLRRRRDDGDLEEELRLHLELAEEAARQRGQATDAARLTRLQTGGMTQAMDAMRDQRGLPWLEDFWRDVRHALRTLRRNPILTSVALVTLALGIGANTAIFSVLRAASLSAADLPDPDRVAIIQTTPPGQATTLLPARLVEYFAWKERNRVFTDVGAILPWSATLGAVRVGETAERLSGFRFTASAFRALRVPPQLGRVLTDADMPVDGPDSTVVISDSLWRSRFNADPAAVGRTVVLDGRPTTIVGVMPAGFWSYTGPADFWIGMGFTRFQIQARSQNRVLTVVGRLATGTSLDAARGDLAAISAAIARDGAHRQPPVGISIRPLQDALFGNLRQALLVLQGAVAFVLLIACANVAGLLLTRAAARHRDVAIRRSLGASRARVVRLFLTESLILSLAGGAAGAALAWQALQLLRNADPTWLPRASDVHLDLGVLALTAAVSLLTGLAFGLAPATGLSKADVMTPLKESARGTPASRGARRLQGTLLVGQVALTLVLLVGAGLLMRSFWQLQRRDLGFDAVNVLTVGARLPATQYYRMVGTANGVTQLDISPVPAQLFERIRERLMTVPGVQSVAGTNEAFSAGGGVPAPFAIEGRPVEKEDAAGAVSANYALVTPAFFQTMRIPVVEGREFTATDTNGSLPVAIINQAMARRYWPNEDPLGRRLTVAIVPGDRPRQIVGIVGDTPLSRFDREPGPSLYVPHAQESLRSRTPYGQSRVNMTFALRIDRPMEAVIPALRRAIAEVDPNVPLSQIQMLSVSLARQVQAPRDSMVLVVGFGAVALFLALFGIYGVVAYGVVQRTQEIGVRMVLGARRSAVLGLVLRRFTGLTAAGILVGLAAAALLTRYLDSLLFEVTALDMTTFIVVPLLFMAVASLAAFVPARRAATLDPHRVLRTE
jgi:putative ABC transport system permease protein